MTDRVRDNLERELAHYEAQAEQLRAAYEQAMSQAFQNPALATQRFEKHLARNRAGALRKIADIKNQGWLKYGFLRGTFFSMKAADRQEHRDAMDVLKEIPGLIEESREVMKRHEATRKAIEKRQNLPQRPEQDAATRRRSLFSRSDDRTYSQDNENSESQGRGRPRR